MSDTLKIARFCWPEDWRDERQLDAYFGDVWESEWDFIHDSEAVIIERRLGEAYGLALIEELWPGDRDANSLGDFAATLAHAPPDARVRAMIKVIEEEEKKTK